MNGHGPLPWGGWWACSHPERPVDPGCHYSLIESPCWACRTKLAADFHNRGDFEIGIVADAEIVLASEALERFS